MHLDALSLTTFNLLNLNEPGRTMYTSGDAWTVAEVGAKVAWTADMLRLAEADVIGFQELWHPGPLRRALRRAGLDKTHDLLVPRWQKDEGIVCAAAVRKGLLAGTAEWVRDFPEALRLRSGGDDPQTPAIAFDLRAFSRRVLRFRVRPLDGAEDHHVLVAHLKSKAPARIWTEPWFQDGAALFSPHAGAIGGALATIRRAAEAGALRVLLTDAMKGTAAPVAVLGDLNDGPDTSTIDVITEAPPFLRPLSAGGRDTALYAVQAMQEVESLRDVYFTYIHERRHGSLDHILVSREFYNQNRDRLWTFEELETFNDHLTLDKKARRPESGDHAVVRARFSRA